MEGQKGFTLLEVLVTLSISMLVIGGVYATLTSSIKYNNITQSHIDLRQEANIIISQMRQQHQESIINQEKNYMISYDQLLSNNTFTFEKLQLNGNDLNSGSSKDVSRENDLDVQFTLADKHNNTFDIDTIIPARKSSSAVAINIKKPVTNFYDYMKNNNVFIFSSDFSVLGSTLVNSNNNNSSIVINNGGPSSVQFKGSNEVKVKDIYIDKKDGKIKLDSSTKLGVTGITSSVHLRGTVELNNGASSINGDNIVIDGDVIFGSSAIIKGKSVIIKGNVTFDNWWGQIIADDIHINGNITYRNKDTNIVGNLSNDTFPGIPNNINNNQKMPSLKNNNWYTMNGYTLGNNTTLVNNVRVFSEGHYENLSIPNNLKNVVIVSTGNIILKNQWNSLTGVLIAPSGKVSFNGASFKGLVISKDGFNVVNGGSSIEFVDISEFFPDDDSFPLE